VTTFSPALTTAHHPREARVTAFPGTLTNALTAFTAEGEHA